MVTLGTLHMVYRAEIGIDITSVVHLELQEDIRMRMNAMGHFALCHYRNTF